MKRFRATLYRVPSSPQTPEQPKIDNDEDFEIGSFEMASPVCMFVSVPSAIFMWNYETDRPTMILGDPQPKDADWTLHEDGQVSGIWRYGSNFIKHKFDMYVSDTAEQSQILRRSAKATIRKKPASSCSAMSKKPASSCSVKKKPACIYQRSGFVSVCKSLNRGVQDERCH